MTIAIAVLFIIMAGGIIVYFRRKEHKKRNLPVNRPIEICGVTNNDHSAIVYIGNGANENSYKNWFQKKAIQGESYSQLGGTCNECAIQFVKNNEFDRAEINLCFKHPDTSAVFAGFRLRMKAGGEWLWYADDNNWHPLTVTAVPHKLFFPGDTLPVYDDEKPTVYILETHWQDAHGNSMDCGYRMFRNKCMAHALGGYKGKTHLNSRRGFLYNLRKKGYRYFETDITLSSDNKLFIIHGFRKKDYKRYGIEYNNSLKDITSDKVRNLNIYGEHPMNARAFYRLFRRLSKDITLEVDIQDVSQELARKKIEHLVSDFRYDRMTLNRCLIQVYGSDVYKAIEPVWNFEVYQYNIRGNIDKVDEIINYCLDNGICAVSLRAAECTQQIASKIKNSGLYILAYTIKYDVTYANTVLSYGVDTICTDFITEKQIDQHDKVLDAYPFKLICQSGDRDSENVSDDECAVLKDGSLEIVKAINVCNDGSYRVPLCPFNVSGRQFAGWNAYVKRDKGTRLFYCDDTLLRTVGQQGKRAAGKAARIFDADELLPIFNVRENDAVYLIATWRELSRGDNGQK